MNTEYKEGNHDEFIQYLFTNEPKPQGAIQLESPLLEPGKNEGLHIFEQLLMIFVDGLKFFYKDESGKINLEDILNDRQEQEELHQTVEIVNWLLLSEIFLEKLPLIFLQIKMNLLLGGSLSLFKIFKLSLTIFSLLKNLL